MAPGLVLFDDARARNWEPFALTRPIGELRFGYMKLVERAERALGLECLGYLTSPHLVDYGEPDGRPVLTIDALPRDRDLVFWCARAVARTTPQTRKPKTLYAIDGAPVGYVAPAGTLPDFGFFEEIRLEGAPGEEEVRVDGHLLQWPWDLVLETPDLLTQDLLSETPPRASSLPDGVHCLGDGALMLGRNVRVEPGTVFDTTGGPIRIGDEVEIRAGTRLAGPAAVESRSRLLGGSFERIVAGPYSYLRGEVSSTITLGYCNKAHDGYLGHAYVGRWVNLGAFTTNSDLKNNYRPVKVWTPSGLQDTNRLKIGCFLGDHVKTGIGLLIGTGTVVGAGANIYGSVMPPRHVEAFSWGEGDALVEYRLADFLNTAEIAMARRGVNVNDKTRRYLESCWRKGRAG